MFINSDTVFITILNRFINGQLNPIVVKKFNINMLHLTFMIFHFYFMIIKSLHLLRS